MICKGLCVSLLRPEGMIACGLRVKTASLQALKRDLLCLQMEIALDSLAELEAFKANIPVDLHAAWVRKAQHYIIDGSPSWQVDCSS